MELKRLMGSGEKIGRSTLPFLVIGLVVNWLKPSWFDVGGPPDYIGVISIIVLAIGVVCWAWTVLLILTKVPKRKLITTGPFMIVRHPLYTTISFLVIPWVGILLNSWLGVLIGIIMYIATKRFAPEEEKMLEQQFGKEWKEHSKKVLIPWV